MRTLYIVRHGNTFEPGEAARRIGVRTDLPLVASGRAQAEALGRAFAADGVVFDTVLVSPLRRARETAALILTHQPAAPAPAVAEWLAEIDHGPDEDRPEEEVVARIGREALARWDEAAVAPPGWVIDAEARIAGWQALFAARRGRDPGRVLLVTSNGAARFALLAAPALLGGGETLASLKLRTGAWGTIAIDPAGGVALGAWDQRPERR